MRQKRYALTIFFLASMVLTGCWNYHEVNDYALVAGAAIDRAPGGEGYLLTAELVGLEKESGLSLESEVISGEGTTILEAVNKLNRVAGRRLYWPHATVLIISQEQARRGMLPVIDWVYRTEAVRDSISLLISAGEDAGSIIKGGTIIERLVSFQLEQILKAGAVSERTGAELWNFVTNLSREGISPALPLVMLQEQEDKYVPAISGTAVFVADRLVALLDGEETDYFHLLQGAADGNLFAVENVAGTNTDITLEPVNTTVSTEAVRKMGRDLLRVKVRTDLDLAEMNSSLDLLDLAGLDLLKRDIERRMTGELNRLIKRMQQERSDIFGFGRVVRAGLPWRWEDLKENWEVNFSELQVQAAIQVNIVGSSLTRLPIRIGE